MTTDIAVHTPSGSVTYRYEGPDADHMKLVGVVVGDHVAPVPTDPPLPRVTDGQGRLLGPEPILQLDGPNFPVGTPAPVSLREEAAKIRAAERDSFNKPAEGGG